MAPSPIANLTAVVTDAMKVAREAAVDKLPVAADAVKSAALAVKDTAMEKLPVAADVVKSAALAAKDMVVDKLPVAADSVKAAALAVKDTAMEKLPVPADAVKSHATAIDKFLADASFVASGTAQSMAKSSNPWLAMALHFLQEDFVRLVKEHAIAVWKFQIAAAAAATRETARTVFEASKPWLARLLQEDFARRVKLQAIAGWKFLAAAAVTVTGEKAQAVSKYSKVLVTMVLQYMDRHRVAVGMLIALLAPATMKAPGLVGLRIPRVLFEASPRLYFATVRTGRIVCCGATRAVGALPMPVLIGAGVCAAAYLVAKMVYKSRVNSVI